MIKYNFKQAAVDAIKMFVCIYESYSGKTVIFFNYCSPEQNDSLIYINFGRLYTSRDNNSTLNRAQS